MIEEILIGLGSSLEDVQRKFSGVMVGRVVDVSDPMMLGRVQVSLPAIGDQDRSPWARVAAPMAGSNRGFYFVPEVDDEVLVAFEHGDLNVPYVIGCLWNAKAPPPVQQRVIQTRSGTTIQMNESPPSIEISTPGKQSTITLSADGGAVIKAYGCTVKLTQNGLKIEGKPNLEISSPGDLTISGSTVSISGKLGATLNAGTGTCTVKGSLVQIN